MSLRHAALGLLAQHPASGYDLLKKFQISMANVWPATQSQLYGELVKLADSGLIEVTHVGPRGRKEYAITGAGRAELKRWMTTPEDDPALRSTQLLRVFLLHQLTPDQARHYLESLRRQADTERERYEHIRDSVRWDDSDDDFFGRAALEYGLRFTKMQADWATDVTKALDNRASGSSSTIG
ncbi:PadR family transcriptional regulator [Mycobacterium sp.]|uniref:PadR family transcriptional regulator n=1 Tax=Mycobacterium sp. TaxID=1785 RepID=UPI002D6CB680|nr:PadR family transcriptional regulator [Mycobacterium sp.]HZA11499.1 PadR family transcriptional regulator [Mycobacterium sp.]